MTPHSRTTSVIIGLGATLALIVLAALIGLGLGAFVNWIL